MSRTTRTVLFLAATFGVIAFAQSDRGRISGRVLGPTGAVVPNAVVTAENPNTDLKRETKAGPDGAFLVDSLLSPTYKVAASAPGFATTVISDFFLLVGQERTLDVKLQPSAVQERVTVSSGALAELDIHPDHWAALTPPQ